MRKINLSSIDKEVLSLYPNQNKSRRKMKDASSSQNMGIGKLGDPDTIFVRKFRWLLETEGLEPHFIKKVHINHVEKTLAFSVYELIESEGEEVYVQKWAEKTDKTSEKIAFTTLDGCGNKLYKFEFEGLKIVKITQEFDYSNSDVSTMDFVVEYKNFSRKVYPQKTPASPVSKIVKAMKKKKIKNDFVY